MNSYLALKMFSFWVVRQPPLLVTELSAHAVKTMPRVILTEVKVVSRKCFRGNVAHISRPLQVQADEKFVTAVLADPTRDLPASRIRRLRLALIYDTTIVS